MLIQVLSDLFHRKSNGTQVSDYIKPPDVVDTIIPLSGLSLIHILNAGNARHSKKEAVCKREMFLICQNTGDTGNIMIVYKIHQVFSSIETPRFFPILTI